MKGVIFSGAAGFFFLSSVVVPMFDSVTTWFDVCQVKFMGKEKKEYGTVQVGVRMPSELRDVLEEIAESEERTLSQQMIFFLKKAVAEYEKEKGE